MTIHLLRRFFVVFLEIQNLVFKMNCHLAYPGLPMEPE